ncbi:MAG: DUF2075 domain-containing protein [Cellvibrio sp.]|uniref:DUF2075 domain-containing protein n=1 Tax=Cellvibrio sp. TaxID=1965322 RepID=UPI0031AF5673
MSNRAYYSATINEFLGTSSNAIRGEIGKYHSQDVVHQQTSAWESQIEILQTQLKNFQNGYICFELLIPRMGKRADAVLIIDGIIFVLEFKVGESQYKTADLRQAQGYALDLNCFHEASHNRVIIPILVSTKGLSIDFSLDKRVVGVTDTIKANSENLAFIINSCLLIYTSQEKLNPFDWLKSQYKPTPTIIEAAQALYNNHDVKEIARSDADAVNLAETADRLNDIIHQSRLLKKKTICFVTGVPGAGKTLVGLQIATTHNNSQDEEHAVFLSGNGPLVDVLREALAKDRSKAKNATNNNKQQSISDARRETASFIQNIHHFRDDALKDKTRPPIEKVVIFDEAQRAWNQQKTSKFMRDKRNQDNFHQSEPEFLISVMDRHTDWCVIIALIGGGQEINDGEAGLNGWFSALNKSFDKWNIYYSDKLKQREYAGGDVDITLLEKTRSHSEVSLHLSTSMRSFRAEKLSHFVHYLIHNNATSAKFEYQQIADKYPIYITRDLSKAKVWVKSKVKGFESSGLIASSGAKRLKATGIFVDNKIEAEKWFLNDPDDVRSSHFLEDVATEFIVQGLELDWSIIAWDADYRHNGKSFEHWNFRGARWEQIKLDDKQRYLENTYRVLLTRARQGMIIYIPLGNIKDTTRSSDFYDNTYRYLQACGLNELNFV